jgi:hypothetical protein
MNVGELRELIKDLDDNVNVLISIERGRGLSISNRVELYYYEDYNEINISGEEEGIEYYNVVV